MPARSINSGADTKVGPGEITTFQGQNVNGSVKVINPQESWGGADPEDPLVVRTRAMGARYTMEKGTGAAIDLALSQIGVQTYQYNLIENAFVNGSFGLYVDTQIDEYLNEIKDVVSQTRAKGIYTVCQKAQIVNFTFSLSVEVAGTVDINPEQRNNLKGDITDIIVNFVLLNGVGQKVIASYLVHDILDVVMDKYGVYDVSIIPETGSTRYDSYGNILVEDNEVLEIQNVNINITTE